MKVDFPDSPQPVKNHYNNSAFVSVTILNAASEEGADGWAGSVGAQGQSHHGRRTDRARFGSVEPNFRFRAKKLKRASVKR